MTDNIYDLCLTEDFLLHMEEEAAEEQLRDSSTLPPDDVPEAPPEKEPPAKEDPPSRKTSHIDQEALALIQEMTQLRNSTQREIRQLLFLWHMRFYHFNHVLMHMHAFTLHCFLLLSFHGTLLLFE